MTTVAELAGGLIQLALGAALIWGVAELGCRLFFWVRERESDGE
jgi:hypothetical protein